MECWKDGGKERWKDGRKEGRKDGWMGKWLSEKNQIIFFFLSQ